MIFRGWESIEEMQLISGLSLSSFAALSSMKEQGLNIDLGCPPFILQYHLIIVEMIAWVEL